MDEKIFEVSVPTSIANLQLPEPELLNFYKLADRRVFYIIGEIDESLLEYVKMIQLINIQDEGIPVEERKPIKILVFSEGGMDTPTWALVDTIAVSKTPVYTINMGLAMSNGLSILVSGTKRFTLPHATAMYHSGSAGLQGTKEQIDMAGKYIANQDKVYEKWFVEKTGIDQKLFNRKKKLDWYLTADEMLENGMVDGIINSIDEIL